MLFYLLILCFMFFIYKINKRNGYRIILIVLSVLIIFRSKTVGTDITGYMELITSGMYDVSIDDVILYFSVGDFSSSAYGVNMLREPVFSIVVSILYSFINNAFLTMNVICIIILLIYYNALKIVFKNNTEQITIGLFVYFATFLYFSMFNTLRQAFSTSFLMLGLAYYYKYKDSGIKRFYVLIPLLLACLSHTTAVFALPMFLISRIRIKEFVIWIVLAIALIIDFFKIDVSDLFTYLESTNYSRIEETFTRESIAGYNVYVHYLGFVFHLYLSFYFCWLYHYSLRDERRNLNIWLVGLLLYLILISAPNISRFSEHLYSIQIVIVPAILHRLRIEMHPKYSLTLLLTRVWLIGWFIFYLQSNWYGVVPYSFNF